MKKYELFNDLRDPGDWIKTDMYESGLTLGMSRFWCQMLSEKDYERIKDDREKQFEITMEYLSDLLKKGKIKMKTNNYYEKDDIDGYNGKIFSFYDGIVWNNSQIEEGIRHVKDKWYSIKNQRERESYEDLGIVFTLPENGWMM